MGIVNAIDGWAKGIKADTQSIGSITMTSVSRGIVLLALAVTCGGGIWELGAVPAAAQFEPVSRWEYQILTKEQVLDRGKTDLAAGLNKLGDAGWELVAVDKDYIFKRPKDLARKSAAELKSRIALIENDLEAWKDRVAWSERMVKKGLLSGNQVDAEKRKMRIAEIALEQARLELELVSPITPEPIGKGSKLPK
jgi:hypothetical protein